MLYINNKKIEITKQQVKVGNIINNGIKGYDINIQLEFNCNNKRGYLNLSAGFEKTNNVISFINKEYSGIPFGGKDNQIIFFEVYDTENFLDTEIESEVILKLKNVIDNKIEASFEVNDELINIKFDGYLDIMSIS